MKDNNIKEIVFGILLSLVSMFIVALGVTFFKYPYILDNFKGITKIYIILLGFGFFANVFWYAIFWYLGKEYVQRGIMIVTVVSSLIFIINRFI